MDRVTSTSVDEEERVRSLPNFAIRDDWAVTATLCTNCMTSKGQLEQGKTMMLCSRCKGPWYCSRKCQAKHWPTHKSECHKAKGIGFRQHIETLLSNPNVRLYLEIYAILAFDLLEDEDLSIDSPILMRVDLAIDPSDIRQFLAIMESKLDSSKIEGMVQVNDIVKITEDTALSQRALHSWRESVAKQPEGTRVLLFEFVRSGYSYSWTYCLPLSKAASHLAGLGVPYDIVSTVHGECEVPMKEPNTIEQMNRTIRADKDNRFKLRTELTPADMQAICGLMDSTNKSSAVEMLRTKINRERIYEPVLALLSSTPSA